jgi:hypothetical protein
MEKKSTIINEKEGLYRDDYSINFKSLSDLVNKLSKLLLINENKISISTYNNVATISNIRRETDLERQERTESQEIKNAKKLLQENGFTVFNQENGFTVFKLEPITIPEFKYPFNNAPKDDLEAHSWSRNSSIPALTTTTFPAILSSTLTLSSDQLASLNPYFFNKLK